MQTWYIFIFHIRCYLKVVGKAVKSRYTMNENVNGELLISKPASFLKLHEQDISIEKSQVMILI